MKRIMFVLCAVCICGICTAKTIRWHIGDEVYTTTTCESGDNITPPTPPVKNGYDFVRWKNAYTLLEYLQSTGDHCFPGIDTGIIPDSNTAFRIKINRMSGGEGPVIGTSDYQYRLFPYSSQILFDLNKSTRVSGGRFAVNTLYDFMCGIHYVKDYETSSIIIGQVKYVSPTQYSTKNISIANCMQSKIYLVQIWQNDVLVRDFIPVLDRNDVPCMYDKVENKFYYSDSKNDFIAGPVVSE